MSMNRREFMQLLAIAAAGGMTLHSNFARAEKAADDVVKLLQSEIGDFLIVED